jgi:hypothetical protein
LGHLKPTPALWRFACRGGVAHGSPPHSPARVLPPSTGREYGAPREFSPSFARGVSVPARAWSGVLGLEGLGRSIAALGATRAALEPCLAAPPGSPRHGERGRAAPVAPRDRPGCPTCRATRPAHRAPGTGSHRRRRWLASMPRSWHLCRVRGRSRLGHQRPIKCRSEHVPPPSRGHRGSSSPRGGGTIAQLDLKSPATGAAVATPRAAQPCWAAPTA